MCPRRRGDETRRARKVRERRRGERRRESKRCDDIDVMCMYIAAAKGSSHTCDQKGEIVGVEHVRAALANELSACARGRVVKCAGLTAHGISPREICTRAYLE